MGDITDEESFRTFVRCEVQDAMVCCDLPLFREAWQAGWRKEYSRISDLDALAWALRPTFEMRRAGTQTGRQTWRLYGNILPSGSRELEVFSRCSEFLVEYQSVVVCGVLAAILGIPREAAQLAYAQQVVGNFAQACIKLIGLGPTRVQKILHDTHPLVEQWVLASQSVPLEEAGALSPRWDIASSQHAYADARLYIS